MTEFRLDRDRAFLKAGQAETSAGDDLGGIEPDDMSCPAASIEGDHFAHDAILRSKGRLLLRRQEGWDWMLADQAVTGVE